MADVRGALSSVADVGGRLRSLGAELAAIAAATGAPEAAGVSVASRRRLTELARAAHAVSRSADAVGAALLRRAYSDALLARDAHEVELQARAAGFELVAGTFEPAPGITGVADGRRAADLESRRRELERRLGELGAEGRRQSAILGAALTRHTAVVNEVADSLR